MSRIIAAVAVVALTLAGTVARADDAAKAAVTAAFAKMAQAKSYKMTMHSASGEMTQEYVAPDRRHMAGGPMEMITIGDDTWVKVNGKWQHLPKAGPMPAQMGSRMSGPSAKPPQTDVTFIGSQDCQGHTARVYGFNDSSNSSKSKFWVDSSGYPCRMEMSGSGAGSWVQWSDWGAPITISAPQ